MHPYFFPGSRSHDTLPAVTQGRGRKSPELHHIRCKAQCSTGRTVFFCTVVAFDDLHIPGWNCAENRKERPPQG